MVLAISDETENQVKPFLAEHNYSFTILLDPGRKVNDMLAVQGIPRTLIYDRSGKLVAQSINLRSQTRLLEMLKAAGME